MLDPLDIVIPTPLGVKRGRLGGPLDAAGTAGLAVVLLDESGANPLVERIFAELSSYLQAAGTVVVRMPSLEPRGDPLERICALIGAVTAASHLGPRRVAVVLAAPEATGVSTAAGAKPINLALAGLVGLAAARSRTGAQLALSLAGLTGAVRAAADTVVATATLMAPDTTTRARRASWGVAPPIFGSLSAAPHRILALSQRGTPDRQVATLISELYIWALQAGNDTTRAGDAGHPLRGSPASPSYGGEGLSASVQARTHATAGWLLALEEQWQVVFGAFEQREPERAAQARSADVMQSNPAGFHALQAARVAWRSLDSTARMEWLRACGHVFETMRIAESFSATASRFRRVLA